MPYYRRPKPGAFRFGLGALLLSLPIAGAAAAQSVEDLRDLSIDQLAQLQVTSVSKSPVALSDAPAAVFVITGEDIRRAGVTSIPEVLRLAPNLQVAQTNASSYVITARGFSGNSQAQSFSDKLLVLIDGRSVYTPLYSGVYWDMQDVPLETIERIEVISGPGAALWGANAVNGVINIITRKAADTQGLSLNVSAGDLGEGASLVYGGKGGAVAYRLYAKDFYTADSPTASGAKDHDHWSKPQLGFRVDWDASSADTAILQGDAYRGAEAQVGATHQDVIGANLLGRWRHTGPAGELQVQGYYDRTERGSEGGGHFDLDIYDLDVQQSFDLSARHQVVLGGGVRIEHYQINGTASLFFLPPIRTLTLGNLFAQDTVSLADQLALTLGLKLEDDPYSRVSALPSVRLSWKANPLTLIWAAASRAIRSATPFDRDVVEKLGGQVFLTGGDHFGPEKLDAYEFGERFTPTPKLSFSVSTFYNVYDDLRSIEPTPVAFLPLYWGNGMRGSAYGVEAWADYSPTDWWRLSASIDMLEEKLKFKAGASGILGVSQAGDDPERQAAIRSSFNLSRTVSLDANLRYVSALPDPHVPSYVEAGGRIAWAITPKAELSLSGFNLLHKNHQEFPAPADPVPRRLLASLAWRF